jgi:hypothetical protein
LRTRSDAKPTNAFIGEDFDYPALDTRFLAAPVTVKHRLRDAFRGAGVRSLAR